MAAKEETKIELQYRHAYSTDDLRTKRSTSSSDSFGKKASSKDNLIQIKTCVTNKDAKLTVIGQTDGQIIYWRPRRINANSTKTDQAIANQLKCYQFDGHYNASIHALCYGLCDIMDPKHKKYGLIISGAADSKIKFWDPWHRDDKTKDIPVLELEGHHNGTILCLEYADNQLISGSTDCTMRIWMVYLPQNNSNYHLRRNLYANTQKLKQSASQKNMNRRGMTRNERINMAKCEHISHAFSKHFANLAYFKKSSDQKSFHLMKKDKENDTKKSNKKHQNDESDEVIYPEIKCQQIIKFDAWCRCIVPSINSKYLMIADDNGILYAYHTAWNKKKSVIVNNSSTASMRSNMSKKSQRSSLEGSVIANNKSMGERFKVKTTYICDNKSSPVYNAEYYSKLHRLSIIHMVIVPNCNYIITLSSDFTLQVHDSVSCDAVFGVKNPENCKYICADYNCHFHELYVVDEHGMLQIWDVRRERCLHAQQLRKAPLLKIECSSPNEIIVTAADCIEVWNIQRTKRAKNAQGHKGDVINVVVIGPSNHDHPSSSNQDENQENINLSGKLSADELENNLRNLDTVMYSAGIDNTIRSWDIQTMNCRGVFDSKESDASISEISTLIHLPDTRALITGHHNGMIFWWNTDQNASNTKLPHAHSDAVIKIHHHYYNNNETLFSVGQDGLLAIYDVETKKNEKILLSTCFLNHWQQSVVLTKEHATLSIVSDEQYCYVGSSDGTIYQYDIDLCQINKTFEICKGQSIIDLQIDSNFLYIAREFGDVILWELSLEFEIDRINVYPDISNRSTQKCVGIHIHQNKNLLLIIYESDIFVYDYVNGTINEKIHSEDTIASSTFYNDSIFCGCKNSVISRIRLKSFNECVTGIVENAAKQLKMLGKMGKLVQNVRKLRRPSMKKLIARRRSMEAMEPTVLWNKDDNQFQVNFNHSFPK